MRPTHVFPSDQLPEPLSVIGEAITVFGAGDASKPFEVHLLEGRRGGGPPPHHHPWDEAFFVLEGEVEFTVAGKSTVLGQGAFVHLPGNTIHAYRNVSETARLLGVVSDCRSGEVFAALDAEVRAMPDDAPKVPAISARYGVTFEPGGPA